MDAYDATGAQVHGQGGIHLDRRRFLTGMTAAGAVGATTLVGQTPASAGGKSSGGHGHKGHGPGASVFGKGPAPEPIPATVPTAEPGFDPPPPFDFIHWLLPGPEGATTQILELPAFGLDVDPSLITNFRGFTAYAVIAGTARGHDGERFDCEFDVRVMRGRYRVDDEEHRGTFAFF